jgi:hypothetical protein
VSICEISGSHGGEYEDDSFMGYTLMMETVRTCETSVFFNEITLRCIAEGCQRQLLWATACGTSVKAVPLHAMVVLGGRVV